jgi:hypothetical protein
MSVYGLQRAGWRIDARNLTLQRPYLKGRDLYDLMWYLSDPAWPPPNLVLLNNALEQTGWSGGPVVQENWAKIIKNRLETVAWEQAVADVRPFLETGADAAILTPENLRRVLAGKM